MTAKVERTLRESALASSDFLDALNREVVPVLRNLRRAFNNAFGGPVTVDSSQIMSDEYQVWLVDASAGPVTLTLPSALAWAMKFYVKKIDSSGNAVTIAADGTDTIEGSASTSLASQYDATTLWSDESSEWHLW